MGAVRHDSYVVITVSEARLEGGQDPDRFIGSARPLWAGSIAPRDGYVQFST